MDEKAEREALKDVLALEHYRFRYKARDSAGQWVRNPSAPLHRGLVYEASPASIQGEGKTVVIDARLANLEMALKQAAAELEGLQKKLDRLEGGQ